MQIKPIAYIQTDFKEKFGIPRQSGRSPSSVGRIVFVHEFNNREALRGIEDFSHIWLIFGFSKSRREIWSPTVRPPRLGGNRRVGVFASRSPFRPNSLGLSSVRLLGVEETKDGLTLLVSGADLLDGTPIYDIKPYLPLTDSHPEAVGAYSDDNWEHRLKVDFPAELLKIVPNEKQNALIECLADDPRPSYQDDDRVYRMRFSNFDITFTVNENTLIVTELKII